MELVTHRAYAVGLGMAQLWPLGADPFRSRIPPRRNGLCVTAVPPDLLHDGLH